MSGLTQGLFIAIEGIDGTGKSTLARNLRTAIHDAIGVWPVATHEPSSPELEHRIRELFKREAGPLAGEEMATLFTADRILHLDQVIRPALAAGQIVICDRYKLSTQVYQHGACRENVLESLCSIPPEPDLTILLTIDPAVARARMVARNPKLDSYEADLAGQREKQDLYLLFSGCHRCMLWINESDSESFLTERAMIPIMRLIQARELDKRARSCQDAGAEYRRDFQD
jgi:dTMP kinase